MVPTSSIASEFLRLFQRLCVVPIDSTVPMVCPVPQIVGPMDPFKGIPIVDPHLYGSAGSFFVSLVWKRIYSQG